jgi:hypothetical protein
MSSLPARAAHDALFLGSNLNPILWHNFTATVFAFW